MNNYLIIQQQLIAMESYRDQLGSYKPDFLMVTEVHKKGLTEPPVPNFIELGGFLENNDCTRLNGNTKENCYKQTRLQLIQANDKLDKVELENFLLNRSIDRLQEIVSKIIDEFPVVKPLSK